MILKFVLHFLDAQGPNWAQRGRYGPVRGLGGISNQWLRFSLPHRPPPKEAGSKMPPERAFTVYLDKAPRGGP